MKRFLTISLLVVVVALLAACESPTPTAAPPTSAPAPTQATAPPQASGGQEGGVDQYGERYDANPAILTQSVGTTEGVPDIAKAAFYRAGLPVDDAKMALAVKCFKENVCDTGTGGKLTVALADGFGENFWRQMTKMEFILQ